MNPQRQRELQQLLLKMKPEELNELATQLRTASSLMSRATTGMMTGKITYYQIITAISFTLAQE